VEELDVVAVLLAPHVEARGRPHGGLGVVLLLVAPDAFAQRIALPSGDRVPAARTRRAFGARRIVVVAGAVARIAEAVEEPDVVVVLLATPVTGRVVARFRRPA